MKRKFFLVALAGAIISAFGFGGYQIYIEKNKSLLSGVTQPMAEKLYHPRGNLVEGNPNGAVTMVLLSGYNCEYCRLYHPLKTYLVDKHPDLRVIHKAYLVFGNISKEPAYASLAAHLQNSYLPMHNAMMSSKGILKKPQIADIAEKLGINSQKLLEDMEMTEVQNIITSNTKLVNEIGITGAPTAIFVKTSMISQIEEAEQYFQTGHFTRSSLEQLYKRAKNGLE